MNIAANIFLVFMIPLTILTNAALRDSQRLHGPDVMGPAFYFVVSAAVRWIGALIVVSCVIGGGSFDPTIPHRGVQVLMLAAAFALVDWAAGIAAVACAPSEVSAGPALIAAGRILSFAIPIAMLFWLMPMLHNHLPRAATWTVLVTLVVISLGMLPVFYGIYRRTNQQKQERIAAYWQNQVKLIAQGKAEIAALPLDSPLEQLTKYLVEDWPPDVRTDAFCRLEGRSGVASEVLTMLADNQRRAAAVKYVQQLSTEPAPGFNMKLRDFSLELAQKYKAADKTPVDETTAQLAADCEGFVHVAYGRHSETLSFYPAMDAWRQALAGAPQTPAILEARKNVDHWFELYPRTVAGPTSPAAVQ